MQLDARDQIDELCTALTETERQVYQEHYVQGFTLQEVAHHCHRSLVSVKASLRQIKKKPIIKKIFLSRLSFWRFNLLYIVKRNFG